MKKLPYVGIAIICIAMAFLFYTSLSPEWKDAFPGYCLHYYTPKAQEAIKAGGECSVRAARHPGLVIKFYAAIGTIGAGFILFLIAERLLKRRGQQFAY